MLEYDYDLITINCKSRKLQIDNILNCEKGGLGGIIGKATDFVGLTDYSGQESAQKNASASSAASINTAKSQLDFTKAQYKDWQAVYGDIQKNLGDYYEKLSGESLVAQQLSAQAREYADAYKQVNQQLAQRGLSQSGIAAAQDVALGNQSAITRAGIRASGDTQAMQQKAGFLQLGLNSQASLLGNIGNASNSLMQGYQYNSGQQYKTYSDLRESNQQTTSSLTGGLIGGAGQSGLMSGAMTGMLGMFSDVRLKKNIKFIKEENGYNIYSWDWNDKAIELGINTEPNTGVLAQELLHTDAISKHTNGYYTVDYSKLKGFNNGN